MSDELVIKVTNTPRPMLSYNELPESERGDFDYMLDQRHNGELDDKRFVRYRGSWYDTRDLDPACSDEFKKRGFDGQQSDSFFSGILFKFFDDEGKPLEDEVVVGRYIT